MAARRFPSLFLNKGKTSLKSWSRPFHSAVAKFTSIDPKGMPVSYDTDIKIGDPGDSYIYIEPKVGDAIKCAVAGQLGPAAIGQSNTLPLQFNHDSFQFSHKTLPFLRIDIPQNLGQSKNNISAATLWLSGHMYPITLDGSPDEAFEKMSTETGKDLKGALDRLKDS